jgi:hypothetical protein
MEYLGWNYCCHLPSNYHLLAGTFLDLDPVMFIQSLFLEIDKYNSQSFNGYASASTYLLAAIGVLIPVKFEKQVAIISRALSIVFPLINGTILVLMSICSNIFVLYGLLIIYVFIFEFTNPVVSVQTAKSMPIVRYGLIFSINTAFALLFQILVQFMVGSYALHLNIQHQFLFYGCCLLALGGCYIKAGFICFKISRISTNRKLNFQPFGCFYQENSCGLVIITTWLNYKS